MKEPTQEEIKRLLQWCGFQCYYKAVVTDDRGIIAWVCPPDSERTIAFYGITLDFLFKWAVPKLAYYRLEKDKDATVAWVQIYKNLDFVADNHRDNDPALALFWAINSIIEGVAK